MQQERKALTSFFRRRRYETKMDYPRRGRQSAAVDKLAIIAIKREDNALLLNCLCHDLCVLNARTIFNNRGNFVTNSSQKINAWNWKVFVGEENAHPAAASVYILSSRTLSAA